MLVPTGLSRPELGSESLFARYTIEVCGVSCLLAPLVRENSYYTGPPGEHRGCSQAAANTAYE